MYLTNSLTRKKEKFEPINPADVRMYVCGPTVYDRPHLGNARSAVVYDLLFRILNNRYEKVTYVRNITDVDDKIINASKETGLSTKEISRQFEEYYKTDLREIGCVDPSEQPRATENIAEMIEMIKTLISKDFAYEVEGHVLFNVVNFKEYGKLSGRSRDEMIAGARVEVAPYKKDPADFVLWKPSKKGEEKAGFESPWGHGRPGWHIECSAMSKRYLGESFDIHGGGADLMFPHHENEIAQSECANSHPFAKYWVHNGFLMVNGDKMSKSLGNFRTVRELLDEGIDGNVIRFAYMNTHYRKPLDFSDKLIEDSELALKKFAEFFDQKSLGELDKEIVELLEDDLNTPSVIAKCHEYHKLAKRGDNIAIARLNGALQFLGFDLSCYVEEDIDIPDEVTLLKQQRDEAKSLKDWKKADEIREALRQKGWVIEDSKDGSVLKKLAR